MIYIHVYICVCVIYITSKISQLLNAIKLIEKSPETFLNYNSFRIKSIGK